MALADQTLVVIAFFFLIISCDSTVFIPITTSSKALNELF